MLMCYVDESGDTGSLDPSERNSQPIFLISAVLAGGNRKVSPLAVSGPNPLAVIQ